MGLNPLQTAVVLIEFQNDFASPGGALHKPVAEMMEATGMIGRTAMAVTQARAAGATIIHCPISFAAGLPEVGDARYGILADIMRLNAFVRGTWGASIVPAMAPVAGDVVVEGKRGLDAFMSTNLDFVLRSRGLTNIAMCGFLTNCCVESTMRSAYERGFTVYTLTDCLAALSPQEHANAVQGNYPMFSFPVPAAEFIAALDGVTAARAG